MKAWKTFVHSNRAVMIVWCLVILIAFVKQNFLSSVHGNYYIFKYTYHNAVDGVSLYGFHPGRHADKNHYGPLFSVVFAPFALLPDWAGLGLWLAALVLLLLFAVRQLPLDDFQKNGILLICVNELLTAAFNVQFNIAIAAFIILTFAWIIRQKEFIAPIPSLVGTFVKLYGIVGFAFFFLVKNKLKFILGCVAWALILFVLPMAISSPEYIINSYVEWYQFLVIKNSENISLVSYQDVSIMGFFRRLFADSSIPNLPFLIGGALVFLLPYYRISQYKNPAYQLLLLASTLMFPVIFSSSSEASTYIIVFAGIGIWFMIQPRPYSRLVVGLLVLSMVFGSLNTTDIYPAFVRDFLREHSIKAIPCFVIWIRIIFEMCTSDFSTYNLPQAGRAAIPG